MLEEFFGSDQLTKLNQLKTTLGEEDNFDGDQPPEMELKLRGKEQKLKIPINPNFGPIDRNRMSYDVASEMEQLRARIQERARIELEDLDKKYSPKLAHPGFGLLESSNHSRQGSLDSSIPQSGSNPSHPPTTTATKHSRQASLPVFFDTASVTTNITKKSPTLQLKTQVEKSGEKEMLSPSPPLNYVHVRQTSGGSSSSFGSGTVSPPLILSSSTSSQQRQQSGLMPYSTPPLIRSPQRNIPQFQSLREHSNVRPHSGKLPSQNREPSHTHSHSQPAPLPSQFTVSKTGYSTSIVKKRHSPEGVKQNGYTASRPPLPANHSLQMTKGGSFDLDRPEVKSVTRATQLRRAPSGEKVAASPRMGRDVTRHPPTVSQVPGPSNTHHRRNTRLSEPGDMTNFQTNQIGAEVYPETIEPYTTSIEMRKQVFKYTPFTDKDKSNSSLSSGSKKTGLLPKEQTWC